MLSRDHRSSTHHHIGGATVVTAHAVQNVVDITMNPLGWVNTLYGWGLHTSHQIITSNKLIEHFVKQIGKILNIHCAAPSVTRSHAIKQDSIKSALLAQF